MLIVLDTNCLIQILPRKAKYRNLFDALLQGKVSIALTTEILADYIVTNDAHFNILDKVDFPKVACLSLNEFMKIFVH